MFRVVALAALLSMATFVAAAEPNLVAEVSQDFAASAATQTMVKAECVRDREGKAVITGPGISTTRVTIEFVPNTERAQAVLVLQGNLTAKLQAVQGRVTVCTDADIDFCGRKCICLGADGLCWGPATVRACPNLHLTGVSTTFCLLDPPVRRLANRIYYRKEDQSHASAAWKTERRVAQQFDSESEVQLIQANEGYHRDFLGALDRNQIRLQELRFSTTAEALTLVARLEGAAPADWAPLPALQGRPDIGVRLHQSILNNAAAKIFADKTKTGGELEKDMNNLLGPVSTKVALDPEDRDAFSVTFAPGLPIETTFDKQKIKFQIRTRGFVAGERVVSDPFLIESLYDFRRVGDGLVLERQGEVDVNPPDVAAGQREPSAREVTLSVVLKKRFNKLLPPKVAIEKIELPGELKRVGNLIPTQSDSDKGWLTLGLNRKGKN